ncbi:MAG TPA: winged helix DNA-binding domain-containing protein [Jatrophihabitans sp.]|jgi:hypothetical protein
MVLKSEIRRSWVVLAAREMGRTVRKVSIEQRRALLVRRHHLTGDAVGPEQATRAVVALHATDPASVYLSVLARSRTSTLQDVAAAMYERRTLVRWMAMRRTLFLFGRDDIPMVQAAVSTPLAAALRRRLISRIERNGTEPPVAGPVDTWLQSLEHAVADALVGSGSATGAQLAAAVPALGTVIAAPTASERPQALTSLVLTLMSAEGGIVRASPTGAWTSRHHRWEPVHSWWPAGIPKSKPAHAESALVRRWLERFGPATLEDLQWWTGWTKTTLRRALEAVTINEVDLHGQAGIDLVRPELEPGPIAHTRPNVTLLPALDPTPMGWKHRDWFFGIDRRTVFDRTGNVGPTIWLNGEVVGSWAATANGVVTALLIDRGHDAAVAVEAAADQLTRRLDGIAVTPAARTPLEQSLV